MRLSRYYAPTLKETPAEAEVISHKLLLRAGMIRKLTAGIHFYEKINFLSKHTPFHIDCGCGFLRGD